jgi:hypothetical protein
MGNLSKIVILETQQYGEPFTHIHMRTRTRTHTNKLRQNQPPWRQQMYINVTSILLSNVMTSTLLQTISF